MRYSELVESIPGNARSLSEDEFYQFVQSMIDNSNYGKTQKDEFTGAFVDTGIGNGEPDSVKSAINNLFSSWNLPYRIDKIHVEQGYEDLFLMRKI